MCWQKLKCELWNCTALQLLANHLFNIRDLPPVHTSADWHHQAPFMFHKRLYFQVWCWFFSALLKCYVRLKQELSLYMNLASHQLAQIESQTAFFYIRKENTPFSMQTNPIRDAIFLWLVIAVISPQSGRRAWGISPPAGLRSGVLLQLTTCFNFNPTRQDAPQSQRDGNAGGLTAASVIVCGGAALKIRRRMLQSQSWETPDSITITVMDAGGHLHADNSWGRKKKCSSDVTAGGS